MSDCFDLLLGGIGLLLCYNVKIGSLQNKIQLIYDADDRLHSCYGFTGKSDIVYDMQCLGSMYRCMMWVLINSEDAYVQHIVVYLPYVWAWVELLTKTPA